MDALTEWNVLGRLLPAAVFLGRACVTSQWVRT
jgi:hypothetical protein